MGSLENITPLNIDEEIAKSLAEYQENIELCQGSQSQGAQFEAINNIDVMNRSQQAYHLEVSTFANSIDELGLGIASETEHYRYSMVQDDNAVFHYAIAKTDNIKSYVGGVFLVFEETDSEWITLPILCESEQPTIAQPTPPLLQNNQLMCGAGTIDSKGFDSLSF